MTPTAAGDLIVALVGANASFALDAATVGSAVLLFATRAVPQLMASAEGNDLESEVCRLLRGA